MQESSEDGGPVRSDLFQLDSLTRANIQQICESRVRVSESR